MNYPVILCMGEFGSVPVSCLRETRRFLDVDVADDWHEFILYYIICH